MYICMDKQHWPVRVTFSLNIFIMDNLFHLHCIYVSYTTFWIKSWNTTRQVVYDIRIGGTGAFFYIMGIVRDLYINYELTHDPPMCKVILLYEYS